MISKKSIFFLTALLLIGLGAFFFFHSLKFPYQVHVERGEGDLAFIEVTFDKMKKKALLDLGSPFLSIDQELVALGVVSPTGRQSLQHTPFKEPENLDIFSLNELSLGPLIKNAIDCSIPSQDELYFDEEPLTSYVLGRIVFESHVLIVDFPRDKIVLLESMKDLKETLYEKFEHVQLKAEFLSEGIVVPVIIDGVEERFVLDTGSTFNISLGVSDQEIVLKEFDGPLGYFHRGKFPLPADIKGILGVPFFDQNIVLIDFPQQKVFLLIPS